jgi:hypothetical protein
VSVAQAVAKARPLGFVRRHRSRKHVPMAHRQPILPLRRTCTRYMYVGTLCSELQNSASKTPQHYVANEMRLNLTHLCLEARDLHVNMEVK